ncbi:hypothetical protein GCM10022234_34450 [Aeromicrobium panaciterrae]|uniref:DUF3068 domain-containing protein n=1 Tax=Aeromicrobium panaciterrae TaxID=363861 RepID=UPI0031DFA813
MGKKLGTAALFLGAFMLALAGLSKFYMYDRLAVVPLNTEQLSVAATAPGDDAEYLDVAAGVKVVTGPLKSTTVVTGDVDASKKASKELGRDVAVWDNYTCTDKPSFDCGNSTDAPLSGTIDRVAFDANTGEAVAYKDTSNESDGEITKPFSFEGLYFKFPFDTQKKTYQWWDGTLKKGVDATYVGEGKVKGMKVYKFEQTIEPVKTGTIDVPGDLVGSDEATVTADRIYSVHRTFSVDPVTGVVIVGEEAQDSYLEVNGERRATTTKATLGLTDDTIQASVDEYKTKAMLLTAVKTWIPVGGGILGVLLIAAGLMSRRGNAEGVRKADKGELVGTR